MNDLLNLIYGLVDPRTLLIRYVGMSSTGTRRPKCHGYASCPDTYCRRWVKNLQNLGLTYQITVLEVLNDASGLSDAERWWIAYGKACDWPLTNLTAGGSISAEALAKRLAERVAIAEQKRISSLRSPEELAEIARIQREKYPPPKLPRHPAEIKWQCFKLFEKYRNHDNPIIRVVIEAHVTPDTAKQLYAEWLNPSPHVIL